MKLATAATIVGIIATIAPLGAWIWSVAGQARHNRDVAAWSVAHESWADVQIWNLEQGKKVDWPGKP